MGAFVWTEWRAMWVGLFGLSGGYMGGFVWTECSAILVGLFGLNGGLYGWASLD